MWLYVQSTGDLIAGDGEVIKGGYAGIGEGLNNPGMQFVKNVGPICCGRYTIEKPHDLEGGPHGPYVLALTPHPRNVMQGRDGFAMHGDKIDPPPKSASNGCIIEPRPVRERVSQSGDPDLLVVATPDQIPT